MPHRMACSVKFKFEAGKLPIDAAFILRVRSHSAHINSLPRQRSHLQVWGPSDKVINANTLSAELISDHMWWLLRTTGARPSGWGHNVERHNVARPSIQGPWHPAMAAMPVQMSFSELDAGLHEQQLLPAAARN